MQELAVSDVTQCGDVFLLGFKCPECNESNLSGYPLTHCSKCQEGLSELIIELPKHRSRYRLLAGTKRKSHIKKRIIRDLIAMYGSICTYCNKDLTSQTIELEHIIPLCVGGTNNRDNLTLSCTRCNRIAGSRVFQSLSIKTQYIRNKI